MVKQDNLSPYFFKYPFPLCVVFKGPHTHLVKTTTGFKLSDSNGPSSNIVDFKNIGHFGRRRRFFSNELTKSSSVIFYKISDSCAQ